MKITNITYNQKINYNKPAKKPSFRGLTKVFEKTVYTMPHERAQRLVDMYDKPNLFVGYFPKDILEILKKATSSATELKPKIQIL